MRFAMMVAAAAACVVLVGCEGDDEIVNYYAPDNVETNTPPTVEIDQAGSNNLIRIDARPATSTNSPATATTNLTIRIDQDGDNNRIELRMMREWQRADIERMGI